MDIFLLSAIFGIIWNIFSVLFVLYKYTSLFTQVYKFTKFCCQIFSYTKSFYKKLTVYVNTKQGYFKLNPNDSNSYMYPKSSNSVGIIQKIKYKFKNFINSFRNINSEQELLIPLMPISFPTSNYDATTTHPSNYNATVVTTPPNNYSATVVTTPSSNYETKVDTSPYDTLFHSITFEPNYRNNLNISYQEQSLDVFSSFIPKSFDDQLSDNSSNSLDEELSDDSSDCSNKCNNYIENSHIFWNTI